VAKEGHTKKEKIGKIYKRKTKKYGRRDRKMRKCVESLYDIHR